MSKIYKLYTHLVEDDCEKYKKVTLRIAKLSSKKSPSKHDVKLLTTLNKKQTKLISKISFSNTKNVNYFIKKLN